MLTHETMQIDFRNILKMGEGGNERPQIVRHMSYETSQKTEFPV